MEINNYADVWTLCSSSRRSVKNQICEISSFTSKRWLIPYREPKIVDTWSGWTSNVPENVLGDYIPIITWKYSSGNSRHWATWIKCDKGGKICAPSGCRGTETPVIYTLSWFSAKKNNWKLGLHLFIHNTGLYGSMLQKAFPNHQFCLHCEALTCWAANQSQPSLWPKWSKFINY